MEELTFVGDGIVTVPNSFSYRSRDTRENPLELKLTGHYKGEKDQEEIGQ